MATLTVYPGLKPDGTRCSVLAQDLVTPIPNAGAIVGYSDYYIEKIAQQLLLTEDPVNSGGTPIELLIPPLLVSGTPTAGQVLEATGPNSATWDTASGQATSLSGLLTSQLSARTGVANNELVATSGKDADQDGGAEEFIFKSGVSAGADGYNKINGPNGQYQRRPTARGQTLTALGLPKDGVTACQATLQARMNSACNDGGELDLTPSGISVGLTQYVLTDTVEITGGPRGATFRGHGGQTQGFASCRFVWRGPADRAMFYVRTGGCVFEKFECHTVGGFPLRQFFDFNNSANNCTNNVFDTVNFICASVSTAPYQYCFTTDFDNVGSGNCEDFKFVRVRAFDFNHSFILHGGGSQPYNWAAHHCHIANFNRLPMLHGQAFTSSIASSQMQFYDSFFYGLEAIAGGGALAVLHNCSWELVKFDRNLGFSGAGFPQVTMGGRLAPNGTALQSTGPVGYAASVDGGLVVGSRTPVTLIGTNQQLGPSEETFKLLVAGIASLTSVGNVYPNHSPYSQLGVADSEIPGGVFAFGDMGMTGPNGSAVGKPLLPRFGCVNPHGQVTITGSSTRAVVDFPEPEANASYLVQLSCTGTTGSPAAGSRDARILGAKTSGGFTIELDAAPGGVASVTIGYTLWLAEAAALTTAIGETDFSADTVRRTADPGGIAGSPAATFVCAVFRLDAVPSGADQFLVDCGFVAGAGGCAIELHTSVHLNCRWSNASADFRTPSLTLTSAHVGKTHVVHFVHDGTVGRMYFNGAIVGTSTAGTLVASTGPTQIGGSDNYAGAFFLTQATLFGVCGGNAAPNAAQVAAHCQAIKAAGEIVECAGVTDTRLWVTDGRATVTDEVGSDDITLVSGTTPVFVTVKPAWGF